MTKNEVSSVTEEQRRKNQKVAKKATFCLFEQLLVEQLFCSIIFRTF